MTAAAGGENCSVTVGEKGGNLAAWVIHRSPSSFGRRLCCHPPGETFTVFRRCFPRWVPLKEPRRSRQYVANMWSNLPFNMCSSWCFPFGFAESRFETGFTVLIFQFVVQRHFLESAIITLCDITNGSFQHTFVKSCSRPKVFKTWDACFLIEITGELLFCIWKRDLSLSNCFEIMFGFKDLQPLGLLSYFKVQHCHWLSCWILHEGNRSRPVYSRSKKPKCWTLCTVKVINCT